MALSFRREAAANPPEALVFAEGFDQFETLADDLDLEFGPEAWEEVSAKQALKSLQVVHGDTSFAVVVVGSDTPERIEDAANLIRHARDAGLTVLLVVGNVSTQSMHRLIREGVAEFTPYPEPAGALPDAINRLRLARSANKIPGFGAGRDKPVRHAKVLTAYGVAGGVGASTFIVNLAWELANIVRRQGRKVALLDFNFQYGAIATYLDVPRREAVYELVSEASTLDQTGLTQALSTYQDRLHVLTAPRDALPLDIVTPQDISAIVNLARDSFDYVLIDMPQSLMNWSEQVYTASDRFYALMETDMRSAQNMFRFLRTLRAEDMSLDRIVFLLNRSPGKLDMSGRTRARRVAESLGITYSGFLPDGGKKVVDACDQGQPLAESARSNPLRKEILRIAQQIVADEAAERAKAE